MQRAAVAIVDGGGIGQGGEIARAIEQGGGIAIEISTHDEQWRDRAYLTRHITGCSAIVVPALERLDQNPGEVDVAYAIARLRALCEVARSRHVRRLVYLTHASSLGARSEQEAEAIAWLPHGPSLWRWLEGELWREAREGGRRLSPGFPRCHS